MRPTEPVMAKQALRRFAPPVTDGTGRQNSHIRKSSTSLTSSSR